MKEQEIKTTFEMGFVPTELTFSIEKQEKVDWSALHYTYWKDRDFWKSKLPAGLLEQWSCLEYLVDEMYEANKDKTPLDEINERMGLYANKIAN